MGKELNFEEISDWVMTKVVLANSNDPFTKHYKTVSIPDWKKTKTNKQFQCPMSAYQGVYSKYTFANAVHFPWKEYSGVYDRCVLPYPHTGIPHLSQTLGFFGKGPTSPKQEKYKQPCAYCGHAKVEHDWWEEMDQNPDFSVWNAHCHQCLADGKNKSAKHVFNYNMTHSQHQLKNWKDEWKAKYQPDCTWCGHSLKYHKEKEHGVPICQFCEKPPAKLHAFNEPYSKKLGKRTKCSVCDHTVAEHNETGKCDTCIISVGGFTKAKMSDLVIARHMCTLPGDYTSSYYNEDSSYASERRVCEEYGVNVSEFRLAQACADYYMLELLVTEGSPTAKKLQKEREAEIARNLATYIDMAVGGEGRYAGENESGCYGSGHYTCGGCADAGCCCDCGYGDNHERKYKAEPDEKSRGRWGAEFRDYLLTTDGSSGRHDSWEEWMGYRKRYGTVILDQLVDCFNDPNIWGGAFGGGAWGTCAAVLRDYEKGAISRHVFIDRCWTLEHNGGSLFNKAFYSKDITWLMNVLEAQAEDRYDFLYKHASPPVRSLWTGRRHSKVREERLVQADMFGNIKLKLGWEDRDPAWYGVQLTDEERRW